MRIVSTESTASRLAPMPAAATAPCSMRGLPFERIAVFSPCAWSAQGVTCIGKGIELEIGIEQRRAQRTIDGRTTRQRMVERAFGQGPEIDVMPRSRQHPGIFELLGAPDFGQPIRVRSGHIAMTRD